MIRETQEMKTYPYGHDFGNTDTDGVLVKNGQQNKSSIPTAFLRADVNAINNLGVKKEDAKNMHIIQLKDDIPFAFGDLALSQGVKIWNGRGDDRRYASKYSIMAIITGAGNLTEDKEFKLFVVTGIPADLFISNPELRKEIKTTLDGSYTFTLDGGKTWRICHIEIETVVMEGAGALMSEESINGNGKDKNAECAVIDIGGGTIDLYAQRNGIPMTEFCKNDHLAVETAAEIMRSELENKYRSLSAIEVREIMYAYASTDKKKKYPALYHNGNLIPPEVLEAATHQGVVQVANDIISFVSASWRQAGGASRFKPVLCIGGGKFFFFEYLKKRIPHLTAPDDPVHANARGYATKAAQRLAQRLAKKNKELAAEGK